MSVRRMLPFLLLNILVSAAVVLLILNWWERRQIAGAEGALATVQITRPVAEEGPPVTVPTGAAPPQATSETLTSDSGETVYIVQPGDILSSIALQFDVPVADIVTANNLTNPDQLFVGQELVIPVGGLPAAESSPTPATTATPAPVDEESAPTATVGTVVEPQPAATETLAPGVVIVQITDVIGVGDLADEAVSIANFGDRQVGLQGWTLTDQDGRVYTFGQVTLFGEGAAILVHTETGQDSASDLFWGLEEAVWSSGETVTLANAEGTIQATFVIP